MPQRRLTGLFTLLMICLLLGCSDDSSRGPGDLLISAPDNNPNSAFKLMSPVSTETGLSMQIQIQQQGLFSACIRGVTGHVVKTLVNEFPVSPNTWTLTWDGLSEDGASCEDGVYVFDIRLDSNQEFVPALLCTTGCGGLIDED